MSERITRRVRTGHSSFATHDEPLPTYDCSEGDAVAVLVMDPVTIQFVLDCLERVSPQDMFTQRLRELRDLAKETWWDRAS